MNTIDVLEDLLVRDYQVPRALLTADAMLTAIGIDSLGLLELMFKIEDRFDVKIPGDPPDDLLTLQDVVRYIDALIANRPTDRVPAAAAQALEP